MVAVAHVTLHAHDLLLSGLVGHMGKIRQKAGRHSFYFRQQWNALNRNKFCACSQICRNGVRDNREDLHARGILFIAKVLWARAVHKQRAAPLCNLQTRGGVLEAQLAASNSLEFLVFDFIPRRQCAFQSTYNGFASILTKNLNRVRLHL